MENMSETSETNDMPSNGQTHETPAAVKPGVSLDEIRMSLWKAITREADSGGLHSCAAALQYAQALEHFERAISIAGERIRRGAMIDTMVADLSKLTAIIAANTPPAQAPTFARPGAGGTSKAKRRGSAR